MRRRALLLLPAVAVAAALVYFLALRDRVVEAHVSLPRAAATIGSGSGAVAVGPDGAILRWLPLPAGSPLPELPLSSAPQGATRLSGTMLAQARVLGACPSPLRPYLRSSSYGESGVDVMLRSGIELRFGDASEAARKWRAVATVLADPSIEALDYVDVRAPNHPAVYGSGHALPPVS